VRLETVEFLYYTRITGGRRQRITCQRLRYFPVNLIHDAEAFFVKYVHGARIVSEIVQLHVTSYALIAFCVPNK